MNIQKYAKIISDFNNVYTAKAHDTNIIVVPFKEYKWSCKFLSRMQTFDKVFYNCNRPIIKALKSFYRTDCITTVFTQQKNHTVLMGNERILFSHPDGDLFLCLTPFWAKNASFVHLIGSDNIYPHKNGVLFLDEHQIPYPGGCYYYHDSRRNNQNPSTVDEYMRICFITKDKSMIEDVFFLWNGRSEIENFPFLTKTTHLTISQFIDPLPVQNIPDFPESIVKSTNLVSKRLSRINPNFLIQDILNTYRHSSGTIDNIGLFVEYPFECDYENSCGGNGNVVTCTATTDKSSLQQYVAFYVNGLNPRKILQVRRPYDRYLEYENCVPDINVNMWTKILYDPGENLPFDVSRVVVDSTILGYKYKNAFMCLCYPALAASGGEIGTNLNTDCVLSPMNDSELNLDANIYVIDSYPYDRAHKLYHVKHKEIKNDLWCLGQTSDRVKCHSSDDDDESVVGEPSLKYAKKADPPKFVSKWLQFYDQNKNKKDLNFGNMDKFKLALILARHKICFKLRKGNAREIKMLAGEYEIRLEEQLVNYINEIRLLPIDHNENLNDSDDEFGCLMM